MRFTIARIGKDETICFAASELKRLISKMDPSITVDIRHYEKIDPEVKRVVWLGFDGSIEKSFDDKISIKVKNGAGVITGSNECSVLIAMYRFMFELGCRFIRPGADGEKIPEKKLSLEDLTVSVCETPSYGHRGVCIEGGVSFDHVYNMIDWLPKVGMSAYFIQFFTPGYFFERYYKRFYNNPNDPDYENNLTPEDIDAMMVPLTEEITKRALKFHAVGHGWTCVPFGLNATGWDENNSEIPEEISQYFALRDGKRELFGKSPLDTNLCYSNPYVRERMTDAVVEYCKEHPEITYLHFWLSDGSNNHCECENCKDTIPSDFYVMMLNMLDEKLTKAGIDTKIVCLIYVDLLWEPQTQRVNNPDRFVLMFAPISRTYSKALNDFDKNAPVTLPPYERNKNKNPSSVAENVMRLKKWQETNPAKDSFDFDYHLMWDHSFDLGYYNISKLLHKDMCELELIGLNGMISCQLQRTAFPIALPIYAMAKGLWDKNSRFEDVSAEYFEAAFGNDGKIVENYLATLSDLFDTDFIRGEKKLETEEAVDKLLKAKAYMKDFYEKEISLKADTSPDWKYLACHVEIADAFANMLMARIKGEEDECQRLKEEFFKIIDKNAPITDTVYDENHTRYNYDLVLSKHPKKEKEQ